LEPRIGITRSGVQALGGRRGFAEHVHSLDLPETAEAVEILAVAGGHRATDGFESALRCRLLPSLPPSTGPRRFG